MKKLISLVLATAILMTIGTSMAATQPETPDLFRYIPTRIVVEDGEGIVEGYFINMSNDDIEGIRELEMIIYHQGEILFDEGSFGSANLENMNLRSGCMTPWRFNWGYVNAKKDGVIVVDSDCYAKFSCRMSCN